jgi:uncharacterized membrane protein YhaH (DUF805 family)
MNFFDAIKSCLKQYATFKGRATRPEFWWFMLFCALATMVIGMLAGDRASAAATLLLLLPAMAVTSRRLHDVGRSGWWQVLVLPVFLGIGLLVLLYWWVQPSQMEPNKFG